MHINNGDILAIKYQTENANKDAIDAITDALGKIGLDQCLVIVVNDFDDLTTLNETDMGRLGWYKFKILSRVMKLPEETVQ
jgi:hypothetical protein